MSVLVPRAGGDVPVWIRVTAEDPGVDSSQTVYAVTLHWMSSDASLASLAVTDTVASLQPTFQPGVFAYSLQLTHAEDRGVVTWAFQHSTSNASAWLLDTTLGDQKLTLASPTATAPVEWRVGDTTVCVMSEAEDGVSNSTYLLVLHRRSNDTALASLVCSATQINASFAVEQRSYVRSVLAAHRVAAVRCSAPPRFEGQGSYPGAVVEHRLTTGATSSTGGSGAWLSVSADGQWLTDPLLLDWADNLLELRVTAEDGNADVYDVQLYVASDDATLAQLTVSAAPMLLPVPLSPPFQPLTNFYDVLLESTQVWVNVTTSLSHWRASILYSLRDWDDRKPGAAPLSRMEAVPFPPDNSTGELSLAELDSTLEINVQSEDLTATRSYKIYIYRAPVVPYILELECSACGAFGTDDRTGMPTGPINTRASGLTPPFANSTLSYAMTVDTDNDTLTFSVYPQSQQSTLTAVLDDVVVAEPASGSSPLVLNVALPMGDSILVLAVRSETGNVELNYTVHAHVLSNDALLTDCLPSVQPVEQQPAQWIPISACSAGCSQPT